MSAPTPGPCETLARLAIQSQRYQSDHEFSDAVDAVLHHPIYDAASALLEALVDAESALVVTGVYNQAVRDAIAKARAAIARAKGEKT